MNNTQEEDKALIDRLKRVFNFHPLDALDAFDDPKELIREGLKRYPKGFHSGLKVACLDIILSE